MSRERNVLSQILKSWAQDHDPNYQVHAPEVGDEGIRKTGEFFTWLIQQQSVHIDLLTLLDRLELYVSNVKSKRYPDGMFCKTCKIWYQFAEPNQVDGTLVCYSCRQNPFA